MKIQLFKITLAIFLSLLLLFFIFSMPLKPFSKRSGEIFPAAYYIGENDEWYVSCEISDGVWWWNDYNLTTKHGSDQTNSREGDGTIDPGFHCCADWHPDSEPVVAYGLYKFTFHFPSYNKIIYIDVRDADWSLYYGYTGPDLYVRWNDSLGYFEYKNVPNGNEYDELCNANETVQIWDLWNRNPNKSKFQPTPPRNFTCTNSGSSGQHPNFSWLAPSDPTDVSFKYKIYRNTGGGPFYCIASELDSTNWIDDEVAINKNGNSFWYYATAYTDYSPESKESSISKINGNPSKSLSGNPETDNHKLTRNQETLEFNFSVYPNPFNSTTNISYFIPKEGYVRITVRNIIGRQILELVNKKQSIGTYHVNFSGQSLTSGLYLVQLQLGNKLVTRKILLFK